MAISDNVVNKIGGNFHYAQSHQNDPLGAAIAKQVIEVIENDKLLQRANEIGSIIREKLKEIKDKYRIIKDVRGRGLMIAIEFEKNHTFSYSEMINCGLIEKHIILVKRPGYEIFRIDPALTIKNSDVEYFLKCLEDEIQKLKSNA